MQLPLLIGNWKLHKTTSEAKAFLKTVLPKLDGKASLAICAPFTLLSTLADQLKGKKLALGAQDVFYEDEGAYTGEISAKQLAEFDVKYVLVGHSERRQHFHEDDELLEKKLRALLDNDMIPVFCIGEAEKEHEKGRTIKVLEEQLQPLLRALLNRKNVQVVVAYEPIWAIGTGKTPQPAIVNTVHENLKELILHEVGEFIKDLAIIYGGSVKPDNIASFLALDYVDGCLPGGSSLDPESFVEMAEQAERFV